VELVVDPVTGEMQAVLRVDFGIPPEESSYCFRADFDQHSKYGTKVGCAQANGNRCGFTPEPVYVCDVCTEGLTVQLAFQEDSINNSAHNANYPTHKHVMKPWGSDMVWFTISANGQYNCVADPFIDRWYPQAFLSSGVDAGRQLSVDICGTKFENVINVVKVDYINVMSGARSVTSVVGDPNMAHFVTAKKAGEEVRLYAAITPDTPEARARINWDGATEDPGNPLEATIPRDAAAKHEVKVKFDTDCVCKEARVWVVWANRNNPRAEAPNIIRGPCPDNSTPQLTTVGTGINVVYGTKFGNLVTPGFEFQIDPLSMLSDPNRPDFTGVNQGPPPSGTHIVNAQDFANGANTKWDVSRRVRVRILSPNIGKEPLAHVDGTVYDLLPNANTIVEDYPADEVKGNDDTSPLRDEDNVPDSNGKVQSIDAPQSGLRDVAGAVGDTIEIRKQFGEFLRLEIEGVWTKVSDFIDWRFHAKLRKVSETADHVDYNGDSDMTDELWIDNGSVSDMTNDDW